ncbi:evolutionarily conserved signaling intermediate in Toll pathway, mitochondrial-like [Oppia nitens]|uniref:evolutionarily conserved signaling intermediate in Toll pathway, mitochondrial-like n=1 Tax=Oppia nitens TaxID=1686743 RepID=UPI0023DBF21F|nr:evolutionarily conserved signaling intermediate in Toll pathway, mitochondrial-like [Oppia nitens]
MLCCHRFRQMCGQLNTIDRNMKTCIVSPKVWTSNHLIGVSFIRHLWGKSSPKKRGDVTSRIKVKDVTLASRLFEETPNRHKEQYLEVVDNFENHKYIKRQGYVEFITAALPYLKDYGVHRDIEVYKALMNIFPKGRYVPSNAFAAGFFHYPLEQRTAVEILCSMERNGVIPDREIENLIIKIFSKYSNVWKKFGRMHYWMTKLRNANPFPLPDPLPLDSLELALLAIKRMCIDIQTKISVLSTSQIEDSLEKTWIVSGQSPQQKQIVEELPTNESVYVEGPFKVWLRNQSIDYFIIRANNPNPVYNKDDDLLDNDELNDVSSIPLSTFGKVDKTETLAPTKNIHIQDDGKILAVSATGTSSRDSLLSWVRLLQVTNPKLKSIPVVFTLKGTPTDIQNITDSESQGIKQ